MNTALNRFANLVSDVEEGYEFLDRFDLRAPNSNEERVPKGKLPDGTRYFRTNHVGLGMASSQAYAITPDGELYDDSGRGYTHGGMSPWRLQYVIQSPESPPSESTPTEEVSPTEGDRYPSETVSGDSGSDVGQLSENRETPQQEEVNTGNTIEVPLNKLKKVTKKGSEFVKENTKMTREQAVIRVSTLQNTDKILSALRACVGKG